MDKITITTYLITKINYIDLLIMTQNIVPNQNSRVKNINRAFLFIITQLAIFVSQSDVFDWYHAFRTLEVRTTE
jgi:hypothetical protein